MSYQRKNRKSGMYFLNRTLIKRATKNKATAINGDNASPSDHQYIAD